MTEVHKALERCLDPAEHHNVARFLAEHPEGEFTIELGCHGVDAPVWNIANDPPLENAWFDDWWVHERDLGGRFQSAYIVLNSDAEDADTAFNELQEIADELDADRVRTAKTFRGAEVPITTLHDVIVEYIVEPIQRRIGGGT